MKMLRQIPKATFPMRPVFPVEARIADLRKRDGVITDRIAAAEQANDRSPAYSDDEAKVEREARALVRTEAALTEKPSTISAENLKSLLHERAVVRRAIEIGSDTLTDLRSAWAQQVMAERMGDYRQSVRDVVLAIKALRQADDAHQMLLKLFGAVGRNSGLPCAAVNAAAALNHLKPFIAAAIKAGIITKDELDV